MISNQFLFLKENHFRKSILQPSLETNEGVPILQQDPLISYLGVHTKVLGDHQFKTSANFHC